LIRKATLGEIAGYRSSMRRIRVKVPDKRRVKSLARKTARFRNLTNRKS
jgi:hypothetical protein